MSKFDELTNVTRKNLFDYQPEGDLPFIKIKELREKSGDGPYVIKALWIASKNSAEAHPIITIEGFNVSIPAYKLQDVENMLQDDPTIEQINKGACGFVIADYENKFGKQVGIRWIKLDEPFEV